MQIFQISKSEYDREMSSIPPHRQSGSNGSGHANGADDNGRDRHHHNHHHHNHHHHQNQQDTEYMDTNERGDENSNEDSPNNNNGHSRGSRYREEENYNNGNGHNNGSGDDDDVYLYMHGVPFSAREAEVKAFFPHHAQPRMVHFLIDGENFKPTGECCVEFGSRGERERALGRDGQLLRNRVIKIRPISVSEYRKYLTDLGKHFVFIIEIETLFKQPFEIYFRGIKRKTTQKRKPSTVTSHAHELQRKAETSIGNAHKPHEKSASQLEFEHETFGWSQLVVESTKTHSIVARAWRWQRIACAQHCRVAAVAARARAAQEIDRITLKRELRGDTRGHTRVVPTLCAHRTNAQDSPRRFGSTHW